MSTQQPTLFDSDRQTQVQALEQTVTSLRAFGAEYKHWAIAFSGGKDSTAAVTVLAAILEDGRVPQPESITVLYADTRMELPPLQASAYRILEILRARGWKTEVVLPEMDDRFFVYMFGRGVPPPSNTFRWCTAQLKIEPMQKALLELRQQTGKKLLMMTGVRVGESAVRDARIALSCGRNGAECGQGWFQETTPESVADTLAPLLHWRVCHVWDWLWLDAPARGFPTAMMAQVYGGDEALEVNARTGCIGCNLASRDLALETLLERPKWGYLRPLSELRPLYAELKNPRNRLRKCGDETRADGSPVANPGRMGPLTMEAREMGLAKVLEIQSLCNDARGEMPPIDLLNAEEVFRIRELIAANTWPQRWTGDEERADTVRDEIRRDGSLQKVLTSMLEGGVKK